MLKVSMTSSEHVFVALKYSAKKPGSCNSGSWLHRDLVSTISKEILPSNTHGI